MTKRILCLLLLSAMLAGCAAEVSPTEIPTEGITEPQPSTAAPTTEATEPPDPMDVLLEQMSLRQKVGQLFIIRPDALQEDGTDATQLTDSMTAALEMYPVGGIAMFAQNILSPEQLTAFNEALQSASEIPLFLSVDEEGGIVARLARHAAFNLPQFTNAAAVGSTGDVSQALNMGSTIGAYLKKYGFNMDFAPVADVNTNPYNPIIGTRAFSSNPEIAAQMANAAAEGLNQQGIIAVFKHFPGHGDTAEDSHKGIAVSNKTQAEMESCEWLPFLEAGSGDCIMVGHIAVPEITGDLTPATMSHQIVTEILKEQLRFEGLVITDSLEMGAITEDWSSGDAAIAALQAGCDILLMPMNLQEAFDAVAAAVEDGTLSQAWLDATVRRILEFKQAHGILSVQ